ncbi:hypothetical protein Tsp_10040 [Trichinella spiralis]|nr:hypothetical protein Tsp_10040 [Trichinella spiralis]
MREAGPRQDRNATSLHHDVIAFLNILFLAVSLNVS